MGSVSASVRWGAPRPIRPRVLDLMRMQAGAALASAVGSRKAVALRIGRSVESVNAWCAGSDANPVYRAAVAARASDNPEAIVVHLKVIAMRAKLRHMSVEQLQAELDDIVRRREPLADARQKMAALAGVVNMQELRDAMAAEAELQERGVAIIDELAEREAEGRAG